MQAHCLVQRRSTSTELCIARGRAVHDHGALALVLRRVSMAEANPGRGVARIELRGLHEVTLSRVLAVDEGVVAADGEPGYGPVWPGFHELVGDEVELSLQHATHRDETITHRDM